MFLRIAVLVRYNSHTIFYRTLSHLVVRVRLPEVWKGDRTQDPRRETPLASRKEVEPQVLSC